MVRTSPLGWMTGALCDAFLSSSGSERLLGAAESRRVFTERLEDGAYRYHEVIRAHLEDALVDLLGEPGARSEHCRAAVLLEDAGRPVEAARAWSRAGEWASAARLLGDDDSSDGPFVPSALAAEPWALLATARRLVRRGHLPDALDAYQVAERAFGRGPRAEACRRERAAVAAWCVSAPSPGDGWSSALRRATIRHPRRVLDEAGAGSRSNRPVDPRHRPPPRRGPPRIPSRVRRPRPRPRHAGDRRGRRPTRRRVGGVALRSRDRRPRVGRRRDGVGGRVAGPPRVVAGAGRGTGVDGRGRRGAREVRRRRQPLGRGARRAARGPAVAQTRAGAGDAPRGGGRPGRRAVRRVRRGGAPRLGAGRPGRVARAARSSGRAGVGVARRTGGDRGRHRAGAPRDETRRGTGRVRIDGGGRRPAPPRPSRCAASGA